MKKFIVILVALIGFGLSTYAQDGVIWRGTHKVCGNGAELTLYSSGKMVFWSDGQSYDGTYNINDGYLNLYENGKKIFSFKYGYVSSSNTLNWVDVNVRGVSTRLTKGAC